MLGAASRQVLQSSFLMLVDVINAVSTMHFRPPRPYMAGAYSPSWLIAP
jgi:hypothetical protein